MLLLTTKSSPILARTFSTAIRTTMRAITVDPELPKNAPASALRISSDVPIPSVDASKGECLIKVHATAINRADILQRQGKYPPIPGESTLIGLECSGEVVDSQTLESTGEKVMALLPGGGYA